MASEKPRTTSSRGAVTLAEVASLAQVSEITVSRAIRNKGPVSPQTRARVMAAIKQVGYVPNLVAGSLASAGSNLMGVVIPSLSNIVFADVLRGAGAEVEGTDDEALSVAGMSAPEIGNAAFAAGIAVHELTPQRASLEDVFMDLTADALEYGHHDAEAS